jgi:hypothetical protein
MGIRLTPNPASALEAAERPHPQPLLRPEQIAALYGTARYENERRQAIDNTPFSRTLRHSPLASTMDQ